MLEIQKYLRAGNTTFDLTEQYGIKVVQSGEFPELFLFKYDQLESPMGEQIVQECRGLILNSLDSWEIVAWPYQKFFNYGEGHAPEIDWDSMKVYEKLDGSLMTLYWYGGKWKVASSGNPDAGGQVFSTGSNPTTFKYLFWLVWKELKYDMPYSCARNCTFMFELMTPINKVVVHHNKRRLVLHGIRNNLSGQEFEPEGAATWYNWEICKTYMMNSIEQVVHNSGQLNPIHQEGYIVVDKHFNRVKIKSPQYVALHHMKSSMSPRGLLQIVRCNEMDEFLVHFPEYEKPYNVIKAEFDRVVTELEDTIATTKANYAPDDFKGMALSMKGKYYTAFVMGCIRWDNTVRQSFKDIPIKSLEKWIKLEELDLCI